MPKRLSAPPDAMKVRVAGELVPGALSWGDPRRASRKACQLISCQHVTVTAMPSDVLVDAARHHGRAGPHRGLRARADTRENDLGGIHATADNRGRPYGLSTAACAKRMGIDPIVLGEPMGFWKHNMPEGMLLRSGVDWQLDPFEVHTFRAYLQERGLSERDVEPIPAKRFIDYAEWFLRAYFAGRPADSGRLAPRVRGPPRGEADGWARSSRQTTRSPPRAWRSSRTFRHPYPS